MRGALVGRTALETNPLLKAIPAAFTALTGGQGMFLDDENHVLYPSNAEPWTADTTVERDSQGGEWFLGSMPGGGTRLSYLLPLAYPKWKIAIRVPEAFAFRTALETGLQVGLLAILMTLLVGLLALFIAQQITSPLRKLAESAGSIAAGDLDRTVAVSGEDELGRLGRSLESMRSSLRRQMRDQGILLEAVQGMTSSLDLERSMEILLRSVQTATGAQTCGWFWRRPTAANIRPTASAWVRMPRRWGLIDERVLAVVRAGCGCGGRQSPFTANRNSGTDDGLVRTASGFNRRVDHPADRQRERVLRCVVRGLPRTAGVRGRAARTAGRVCQSGVAGRHQRPLCWMAPNTNASGWPRFSRPSRKGCWWWMRTIACSMRIPRPRRCWAPVCSGWGARWRKALPNRIWRGSSKNRPSNRARWNFPARTAADCGAWCAACAAPTANGVWQVCVLQDVTSFRELDELKTEFVHTVSHDLRRPLTTMEGLVHMLEMLGPLNAAQQEYARRIRLSAQEMNRLVKDLLDLGRVESGVEIRRLPVQLPAIVTKVVDGLKPEAAAGNVKLRVKIPEGLPDIPADASLLERALGNLIENAIRFNRPGGAVDVSIETDGSDTLLVAVKDDGIGIAPADQPRIFEKFFRVSPATDPEHPAWGLGLAIAKSVAEWHGGKIWFETKLGQGSTFYLALPIKG